MLPRKGDTRKNLVMRVGNRVMEGLGFSNLKKEGKGK